MRYLVAMFSLALIGACGEGSTEPIDPRAAAAGTYQLEAVNGSRLPALYFQNSAGRIEFTGGSMVMRADGSFTENLSLRLTYSDGSTENESAIENGTFAVTGSQVTWSVPPTGGNPSFSWTGSVSGDVVTYTYEGISYRFEK